MRIFSFWTDMEEQKRTGIIKISGLLVLAFAFFSLISSVSYLFTWKADLSLLNDPAAMDAAVQVRNAAGKMGAKWGHVLVGRWFGLGSIALVFALFIISFRMLMGKRSFSALKAVLLSVTSAVLASFHFSFIAKMLNCNESLGGGWGGECGSFAIDWSLNLVGAALTGLILFILLALWLFFASKRFNRWFCSLGSSGKETADDGEDVKAEARVDYREAIKEAVKTERKKTFSFVDKTSVTEKEEIKPEPEKQINSEAEIVIEPASPSENAVPVSEEATQVQDSGLEIQEGEELSTDIQEELPRIDVRDELKDYYSPSLELLQDYEKFRSEVSETELQRNNMRIRAALKTYKIDVANVKAVVGPTVTLYKVYPAPGVKISAIKALQNDIAMALHTKELRVVQLSDSVGIEVPNDNPSIVPLKALLNDSAFRESKAELPIAIGYTITQQVKVFDLADAPHLLVAGATKQGKSVGLNVLITSLLYSKHPSELKFVFIDPKMVEFSAYAGLLKHFLAVLPTASSEQDEYNTAIAKTAKQAEQYLQSLCIEMDERYELMSRALVNKVTLYNDKYKDRYLRPDEGHRYLPYIVIVIDEYADLTMSVGATGEGKAMARSISSSIIRLAQKGRAAGIHVVLATQRPSVDVITGLIKSNFPTRIAFRVLSNGDSRTILDNPGAEKLIGKGDMIYFAGVEMERVQCAYISNDEISAVNKFISNQSGYRKSYNTPYYLPAPQQDQSEDGTPMIDMSNLDERFAEAARMVVMSQKGSTSDLQRKLGMGYAKAGRVMDQLEAAGIVGPQEGSKPREVLVADLAELETILKAFCK